MPGDTDYDNDLKAILSYYAFYIKFIDSNSKLEIYDSPLGKAVGASLEMLLKADLVSTKRVIFEQVVVKTQDGIFSRSEREDIELQYKDMVHSSKTRLGHD